MSLSRASDREITISGNRHLRLHAIGAEDEAALVAMGQRSTRDDLRLRFFGPVRPELGHMSSLLANVNCERDFVVGAYSPIEHGIASELLGVVRLIRVDGNRSEFALFVRSDMQKQGLGYRLMQEMLTWARQHGIQRVDGELLRENAKMLRLVKSLGGVIVPKDSDFSTVRVAFYLSTAGATARLVDY